jgi:hypothetical protein
VNRTEFIKFRATPAEKARIEEVASSKGLKTGAWLRRAGMGSAEPPDGRELGNPPPAEAAPVEEGLPSDYEERVLKLARTMPRRSAEVLVRRELARES